MNGHEKSDRLVVPQKLPNNGDARRGAARAEGVEGSGRAKGNPGQQTTPRTQGRSHGVPSALERIREAAGRDKRMRFTALLHHVYDVDALRAAYYQLQRNAAPGVDAVTWRAYGEGLEDNLQALSEQLRRGAYRARPVRRTYIPKPDGRQRPLGVPVLEDKIVQRAVAAVLNGIYETDFLGFSYGFRPGRSPHDALDAFWMGLMTRRVNWVLDADVRGFFDAIDREWLVKFVRHRVGDQRIVRLIEKWLAAGVLEDGVRTWSETGTPQGGSISPLLANVYLHYVFDLWVHWWRGQYARGQVIVVRFADDFVVGFEHRADAEAFQAALIERLAKFRLELHADKTRLLEFGRYAAANRRRRGQGKPETFNFLGFTHISGQTREGRFMVVRRTQRERGIAKLRAIRAVLRKRRHRPVAQTARWLKSVLQGHYRYYGVPGNYRSLKRFRDQTIIAWRQQLNRRSQRGWVDWARMIRYAETWLPPARIHHPAPSRRFRVRT